MSQANKINGALVLHLIYSSSLTVAVVCRPKCAHQRNICHRKLICHFPLGKGNDVRHYVTMTCNTVIRPQPTTPQYSQRLHYQGYDTIFSPVKVALPRLRHYIQSAQGCSTKATTLFSPANAALPKLRHFQDQDYTEE